MSEVIICRGGQGSLAGSDPFTGAAIVVACDAGATIVCTNGEKTFTKVASPTAEVTFNVSYGTWSLTSSLNGKTKTKSVYVDALKVYSLKLKVLYSDLTLGFKLDMNNTDPNSGFTYTDDAVGMSPLACASGSGICNYGSWDAEYFSDFLGIRPCIYKNGQVVCYLDPNNYTLDENGNNVSIGSNMDGDVMIEFKKRWYRYFTDAIGNLCFQVSDMDRSSDGFVTTAFLAEDGTGANVDAFYYGAYGGYVIDGKLRSVSGVLPTNNKTYNTFINYASNTGSGYTIESFMKRMYINGLLMLVTKGRDSKRSIGNGINSRSYENDRIISGTMNDKGLFYGRNDVNTVGCKVFGIENYWGNLLSFLSGLVTVNSSGLVGLKKCSPYGTNYDTSISMSSFCSGFSIDNSLIPTKQKEVLSGAAILPSFLQSYTTIGWPEYFYAYSNSGLVAICGGGWHNSGSEVGASRCYVNYIPNSDHEAVTGARLVIAK